MLDIVGYRPQLYTFEKDRYKTSFGRIIGTLTLTLIVILCAYVTVITFLRSEISLIYNVSNKDAVLNLSDSPFMFVLADGTNTPVSENVQEIRVNFWNFTKENKDEYNTLKSYEIPTEPCKKEHFNDKFDLFAHIDYKKFRCIPANKYNLTLFGMYGDSNPNSFMNIMINMCNNKTNNYTCPDKSQLEPYLKNVFLHMIYIDYDINHYDYENPIKPYVKTATFPINWDLHARYFYGMSNLRYITDYGSIFEQSVENSSYKFSKVEQTVQIRHGSVAYPGLTIGTVTIYRNFSGDQYNRSYPKIQTLLARIGGSIQAIMLIGKAICYIITKNLFLIDMMALNISSNFSEKDQENEIKGSKITISNASNSSKLRLSSNLGEKNNIIS